MLRCCLIQAHGPQKFCNRNSTSETTSVKLIFKIYGFSAVHVRNGQFLPVTFRIHLLPSFFLR